MAVQLTVIQSFDIQSHSKRETKNSHYCLIGPLNAFLLSDDHSVGLFSSHFIQHVFHIIGFLLCLMHALREYWKENKHTTKRVLHTAWCEFVARVYIDLISFFIFCSYIYLVAVVFLFGTFYFHYFILFLLNMIFHYRTFSWVYAVAKFTQHPIHHRRFKMLSSFQIRRMPLDQSLSLSIYLAFWFGFLLRAFFHIFFFSPLI